VFKSVYSILYVESKVGNTLGVGNAQKLLYDNYENEFVAGLHYIFTKI